MEDLSKHIIKELEFRGTSPKPRWYFLFMRGLFWVLAALSAAVGSVAFSVGWYVFFDNDGLHVSLLNVLRVIPYVWILMLMAFIVCAYAGLRQTRRGYRYSAPLVIGLLLATSAVAGLLLDTRDVGQRVHKFLLSHTSFYDALIHSREDRAD